MEVRNVLFPTDFSEASQRALPHAVEFARRFGARITMIHVRTPYADDPNRPEYHFLDEGKYSEFVEKELERASNGIEAGHRVETVIAREVSPAAGILDYLDKGKADLVVMGTHGRTGLGHFFLGSVAERIVRHAPVPVLTVAGLRQPYRDHPAYRRIVVAYDFSKHAKAAALQARELALVYGAEMTIFYVIEQEIHPGYYEQWKLSVRSEMDQIVADARASLMGVLGEHGLDDVEVAIEVGEGDGRAHRDITRHAEQSEADLIVMGTYGLSGVERMLLGSTTERVVRIAPCPVLTFHLKEQ